MIFIIKNSETLLYCSVSQSDFDFFLDSILTNWIKNSEPSNDFLKNQSYFSFKNYLFIYLVVFSLSCSTWVLSVQSTDSVVVEHGLPACGLWSRGLNSCSKVRGISVAPSGIMSHALQGRFFITGLPGQSAESFHHIKKKKTKPSKRFGSPQQFENCDVLN